MADVREVIITWTAAGGAGGVTVLNYGTGGLVADDRLALWTFLDTVKAQFSNTTSWAIATEGRIFDDATGTLTGQWVDTTPRTGIGTSASAPVANATQLLIRWRTGHIVNGRFLQGRTFLPGIQSGALAGGQVVAGTQTAFNNALTTLVASGNTPDVWHRPSGSPGIVRNVTSASVWSEFAILRRRRS